MGRLILVEGLDLAGKSTLIRGLAESFRDHGWDVRVSHGDLCRENPVGKVTRDMMRWDPGFTPEEGGLLFLASHLWDLRNFRPPLGPRSLHIQDSCALRSLAFERVVGSPEVAGRFSDVVDRMPNFDAAFVLTARLETRRARFEQRAVNDLHDQFMFRDPVLFSRVDSELLHLAVERCGARIVATDERTPKEILHDVVSDFEQFSKVLSTSSRPAVPWLRRSSLT